MKKVKTRVIALIVAVVSAITMFSGFPVSADIPGQFNYFSYVGGRSTRASTVYNCPWTNSMVIGSIGIEDVKIIWQEGDWYYIDYTVTSGAYNGNKWGYVPTSAITAWGPMPSHDFYNDWRDYEWVNGNRRVNDVPCDDNSLQIGTVFYGDTVKLICDYTGPYGGHNSSDVACYIQYPAPSAPGGLKRGWTTGYADCTPIN